MKIQNFINSEFKDPSTHQWIDDLNPATDEKIGNLARGNSTDVEDAVQAAAQAFPVWSQLAMSERAQWLSRIADALENNLEEFSRLECQDTGKPFALAQALDIPRAILNFRFFADFGLQSHNPTYQMPQAVSTVERAPLGVVALITPWNLPIYLLTWKLAPALLMGNTVVAKPSELTPLTAHRLALLMKEMNFPRGVFNLVQGLGAEVGEPLITHPLVKAVSFTGGTLTGKRVAELTAPSFKKVSLELGGKNPTLVFDDCDFELTVKGVARSSFLNQGQICLCGSRVLIHEKIFDRFQQALVNEVDLLKPNDPLDPSTNFGSLISKAHLKKVQSYIDLAKSEGAEVLLGNESAALEGAFAQGAFCQPTILTGLSPKSRVSQEEIFGPVIVLHKFKTEEEAVSQANDTPYGLSATVWTLDPVKAQRVSQKLQAGTVWVNTWLMRDLRVPFGGVKQSGVGREGGEFSLNFFSESKTICVFNPHEARP